MKLSQLTRRWREQRRGFFHALPDFLIIGAQKAGTTSLYAYLSQHPLMYEATNKEVRYFDKPEYYRKGLLWYRSHFPHRRFRNEVIDGVAPITGEASPIYLFHPHAPRRISEVLPNAKLIVLLRNPIDRAYSNYNVRVRRKYETRSFEEAILTEDDLLEPHFKKLLQDEFYYSKEYHSLSYLARGRYAEQLERWFQYYPRENFLILSSEQMFADPQTTFENVTSFLGLPPHKLEKVEVFNSARSSGAEYGDMDPQTRLQLREYFAPHNERLETLLDRRFDWD